MVESAEVVSHQRNICNSTLPVQVSLHTGEGVGGGGGGGKPPKQTPSASEEQR